MKGKRVKGYIFYGVFLCAYFIVLLVLRHLAVKEIVDSEIVRWGATIFLICFVTPIIVWFSIGIIKYFKSCVRNIRSCGDELFDELDYYNAHWGETKEYFRNVMNAIAFYYKEGGKVDTVVGNDLKRLYGRLEFLERHLDTKEYLITCGVSVALSICATIICETMFGVGELSSLYGILPVVLFLGAILFRFYGYFNEASNQIYKYEIKLLEPKIQKAETEVRINYQREDILLTKQNLLSILMKKATSAVGKRCETIVSDIRVVEKLELNIEDESSFKEFKFKMGKTDKEGVIFFDGKKIVNEQYEILYRILRKYDLIYEVNMENCDIITEGKDLQ